MYQIGQRVIYGIHGVCRIVAKEMKSMGGQKKEYYVLEPADQPGVVFYVPTGNQAAVAKMRALLTREEFEELLCSQKDRCSAWIDDENQRKQRYRELIAQNDRGELLAMVSALYDHKRQQQDLGRKFHLCDENFLKDATKLLSAEFSLILGISQAEVVEYMKQQLEK